MNPPIKAIVSDSGWEAKPINPFKQYGDAMATDYMEFAEDNPRRPLTQYHTPGEKVTVVPIMLEKKEGDTKWFPCRLDGHDPICKTGYIQQIFFEVVSEEESKASCPKCNAGSYNGTHCYDCEKPNSVEEAAEKEYPVPIGHPNALMRPLRNSERNAFIKGATHILQSGEYVSLKDVEKIINERIAFYNKQIAANERRSKRVRYQEDKQPFEDDMGVCAEINSELNNILTTLKNKQ